MSNKSLAILALFAVVLLYGFGFECGRNLRERQIYSECMELYGESRVYKDLTVYCALEDDPIISSPEYPKEIEV